jgi:predicted cupin superfamily sugar epimerase
MPAASAAELVRLLGLAPHPEGGFYIETFRAPALPFELPRRGVRNASTAIYFLLEAGTFSAFHSVESDEIWHHYLGAPVELHTLDQARGHRVVQLGSELFAGEVPQHVIPGGVIQAARVTTGSYALCGCTVAPGFDFADFVMPGSAELVSRFPNARAIIEALTRS